MSRFIFKLFSARGIFQGEGECMAEPLTLEEKERIEQTILTGLELIPKLTKRGAASLAGISHQELYNLLDQRPSFKDRFTKALARSREAKVDELEDSMMERAIAKDTIAGIFLLKAHRPKLYADKAQAATQHITVNIENAQIALAGQTIEEMRRIEDDDE